MCSLQAWLGIYRLEQTPAAVRSISIWCAPTLGRPLTEHAGDAKARTPGSCPQGVCFNDVERGTNCSWRPLLRYIHAHSPMGVQRRDCSLLKRGMFRKEHISDTEEIRQKRDRQTGQKWGSRKDQGTARANAWTLESSQDSLGVTLL